MINKCNFIVIEGLDGSGKTTTCKTLAEELEAVVYKTPPYPFDQIRANIDSDVSADSRFFFYISSILHASSEINIALNERDVVCDRYIYSTLCYHYALNPKLAYFKLDDFDILRPDFVFYLWAPYEVRIRRITQRDNKDPHKLNDNHHNDKLFLSKVEAEFKNFHEMILIDTADMSTHNIIKQIKEEMAF